MAEPGDGCFFHHCCRTGWELATLLQLTNYLPGGGTWRWLRCSTTTAGQVGKNIGNPLATGYSLAWWRNLEMVALFHHCCRFPFLSNWRPLSSKPWVISWPITTPGVRMKHICTGKSDDNKMKKKRLKKTVKVYLENPVFLASCLCHHS